MQKKPAQMDTYRLPFGSCSTRTSFRTDFALLKGTDFWLYYWYKRGKATSLLRHYCV